MALLALQREGDVCSGRGNVQGVGTLSLATMFTAIYFLNKGREANVA